MIFSLEKILSHFLDLFFEIFNLLSQLFLIFGCYLPNNFDFFSMKSGQKVLVFAISLSSQDTFQVFKPFELVFKFFVFLLEEEDSIIEIVHSNNNV